MDIIKGALMKANRKTNNRKFIIIGILAAIVLLIGASTYYVYGLGGNILGWNSGSDSNTKDDGSTVPAPNTINEAPSTDEQVKAGENIKDDSIERDQNPAKPSSEVDLTVTAYASANDTIRISTIIKRVTNSGQCGITLTKGGETKTATAGVQALSSYSSCKGFTITELSKGTWNISVTYTDGDQVGTNSTTVTL